MGRETGIAWAHSTFNSWRGCQRGGVERPHLQGEAGGVVEQQIADSVAVEVTWLQDAPAIGDERWEGLDHLS